MKENLSTEDKNLLFKGIRPDWMEQTMFRNMRKNINRGLDEYLKGRLSYISIERVVEEYDKEDPLDTTKTVKDKRTVIKTYPPYVKKTEKV